MPGAADTDQRSVEHGCEATPDPECVCKRERCYDCSGDCAGGSMKRFIAGADRTQSMLLLIDDGDPVRVIDALVDALNLAELDCDSVQPTAPALLPSFSSLETVRIRPPQPGAVEPAAGTRSRAQLQAIRER